MCESEHELTRTSFQPLETLRKSCWEESANASPPMGVVDADANTSKAVGRTETEEAATR